MLVRTSLAAGAQGFSQRKESTIFRTDRLKIVDPLLVTTIYQISAAYFRFIAGCPGRDRRRDRGRS